MDIRLLGNERGFNRSPERSAYRLKKDDATQQYSIVVPLDIWFLEADSAGIDRHVGSPRRPPSSWKNMELGRPNSSKGFATLLGSPPNLMAGKVVPFIKCLAGPAFKAISRDSRALEKISRLSSLPQAQVSRGLQVRVNDQWQAEVVDTDIGFALEYLALAVEDVRTYQLRLAARLGAQMIGSPVVATQANGERVILGMLVGLQRRSDGASDAWVLPADNIDE